MKIPNQILHEINNCILFLMNEGLVDDQNFAVFREVGKLTKITVSCEFDLSVIRKNISYHDLYLRVLDQRVYNVKMCDGALIQMFYEFSKQQLLRHRLAFLPSFYLDEFQKSPDTYIKDEVYGDVVARKILPYPFRFDYDDRQGMSNSLKHPSSHLTLGQYQRCRIPVSAPLTPHWFFDFVLRNFYQTSDRNYADEMVPSCPSFDESLYPQERKKIHLLIPKIKKSGIA